MHFDNVFGLSENTKCLNVSFALHIPQLCSQCTEQCCCNARSKRADSVRAVGNLVTLRKHSEPENSADWPAGVVWVSYGMSVKSYLVMTDLVKSALLSAHSVYRISMQFFPIICNKTASVPQASTSTKVGVPDLFLSQLSEVDCDP